MPFNNQPQYDALSTLSSQITYSVNNYHNHGFTLNSFNNIVIGGLGGSGIGGRLVKSIYFSLSPIPVEVVSDYFLPSYASSKTLLILCSYSGNTEETLSLFSQGKIAGCSVICCASGGQLKKDALSASYQFYSIPEGYQPRMALGFSFTLLIKIFAELFGQEINSQLEKIADDLSNSNEFLNSAHEIFNGLTKHFTKKVVIITDGFYEPVGIRFAQQIQENAKAEAFVHVLPEANHNVIESYRGYMNSLYFFIHSNSNERISQRFEFLRSLLEVENNKIIEISVEENNLQTVFNIIYRLDYLSLLMADEAGVDAINVPNIRELKEFLDQMA